LGERRAKASQSPTDYICYEAQSPLGGTASEGEPIPYGLLNGQKASGETSGGFLHLSTYQLLRPSEIRPEVPEISPSIAVMPNAALIHEITLSVDHIPLSEEFIKRGNIGSLNSMELKKNIRIVGYPKTAFRLKKKIV